MEWTATNLCVRWAIYPNDKFKQVVYFLKFDAVGVNYLILRRLHYKIDNLLRMNSKNIFTIGIRCGVVVA